MSPDPALSAEIAADDAEESALERFSRLDPRVRAMALRILSELLATRAHAATCDLDAPEARTDA